MYQEKQILSDSESMNSLVAGIDKLANIVKKTLGPKGANVMFMNQWGQPQITNDGVSIAKQVMTENETEMMAIDALKQQAMRTNMQAGDASTTFITLAQAIIKEGLKSEKHPLEKREEINRDCQTVLSELKKTAKPVSTFEEIKQIATVSVEDEALGHLIAEANEKVGKEGKIDVQESEVNGIRVEYTNGLEIDEGYIAEFMMNNERGEAVIENPAILIVDSKVSNIKDLLPILQKLADSGKTQALLLCDGLDGNMIPTIAMNKRAKYMEGKNVMEIFAVKFPAVRKPEFIEDIAMITQGKVMGMATGLFPDKAELTDLGKCDKVVITSKKTTFIGGKGSIEEKIETLKNQRDLSERTELDKSAYDDRIARLKGQVAVIKVGAASGVDLGYMKDKIEDAIYATKGAIQEGAVRGGGVALKMIALDLPDGILKEALQAPYNQIQENAGGNFKIEDFVMDSVKSTRIVLENACSFAGSLLTTSSSIATVRIKPKE